MRLSTSFVRVINTKLYYFMRRAFLSLFLAVSLLFGGQAIFPAQASAAVFIGVPRTKAQLYQCAIVGNNSSRIYHLKGSFYIRSMTVSGKRCFMSERTAQNAGYRKAKAK